MFRVKICGVTSAENAIAVADAGADAIGLNFYPQSRRYVTPAKAAEIVRELPSGVTAVGLFVNESLGSIRSIAEQTGISVIQLHGDETPDMVEQLAPLSLMRAFRCKQSESQPVLAFLEECRERGFDAPSILLDAYKEGEAGGTGQQLDWDAVSEWRTQLGDARLILAGGLRPGNVAEAIRTVRPHAVDTASGVESSPGVKDPRLVAAFVAAAKAAWSE